MQRSWVVVHLVGLAGLLAGAVALALNVLALRAARGSPSWRQRRRRLIGASLAGLAVFPFTFLFAVEAHTIEGSVLYYGWPFFALTTDMFAPPLFPAALVADLAFWVLAPQLLVLYQDRRR